MRHDSYRSQLLEDYELGWRAAGAIGRENEGPGWMRNHIVAMRFFNMGNTISESATALAERPRHQMM